MMRFLQRLCYTWLFPAAWTIIIIILLCLPGSAIPGEGFFATHGLDKVVHTILFGGNVLFWGLYRLQEGPVAGNKNRGQTIAILVILTLLLGIALEFVQRYFIPNRSFDLFDILADAIGAVAGGIYLALRKSRK